MTNDQIHSEIKNNNIVDNKMVSITQNVNFVCLR